MLNLYCIECLGLCTSKFELKITSVLMSLKVKEIIKEVDSSLILTAEVWTSRATEAYLGLSCHFITKDWQMKTLNFAIMPLEERHTAANIMTWMEELIEKFNILLAKIKAVVHDNGSNMVAAMRMLEEKHGWVSVRCTGHTLHLIVNSVLKEPSISRALGAARSLVEHFRRSDNKKEKKTRYFGIFYFILLLLISPKSIT